MFASPGSGMYVLRILVSMSLKISRDDFLSFPVFKTPVTSLKYHKSDKMDIKIDCLVVFKGCVIATSHINDCFSISNV